MNLKTREQDERRKKIVTFKVTEKEIEYLKEEANKYGTSVSNFIRIMINKGMEKL